jgi:hypothetical protein
LLVQLVAIVSKIKVNVLPFDRAPEALDEDIVGNAAPTVAANAAAHGQQGLLKSEARKLAALVRVKNVSCGCPVQGDGKCL